MMKEQETALKELKALLGDKVLTDEAILREHSSDWIGHRRWEKYNGHYLAQPPLCVIRAQDTGDIAKALKYCNQNHLTVIPQCGRSGVCAGSETFSGAVALDGSAMNQIIKLDQKNFLLTARCGTPLEYMEKYCQERGFTTGHFPQSLPLAQIGGLVATRSTGQLSTLYGGIEELLVGLEAVLADGTVIRTKNVPRRAVGPEPRDLFIGSEGNFAFITEVTVKIFKNHQKLWKRAYAIDKFKTGLEAIQEIMQEGWKPAVVRLHDAVEASLTYSGFINEGDNIMLFVADGPEGLTKATGRAIDSLVKKHGARDLGEKPVDLWYKVRNQTCDDPFHASKTGLVRETCEVSAQWTDIYPIYENVLRRFPGEVENVTQISAHSSHSYSTGTNLYFVFSFSGDQDMSRAKAQFDQAWNIIMEETLRFNGSICHHHGVGKYRAHLVPKEHGSAYRVLEILKNGFDPNRIMNTGTFMPSPAGSGFLQISLKE
jgi:FAD/FMN-containing dehydrogenase